VSRYITLQAYFDPTISVLNYAAANGTIQDSQVVCQIASLAEDSTKPEHEAGAADSTLLTRNSRVLSGEARFLPV
jgi:hypothetical protein